MGGSRAHVVVTLGLRDGNVGWRIGKKMRIVGRVGLGKWKLAENWRLKIGNWYENTLCLCSTTFI